MLRECGAKELITLKVSERVIEDYRQEKRGRPGKDTRYVKKERTYCRLDYDLDSQAIARLKTADGVFPLITNVESLSELEVLEAYKNQPLVEKRFSQLKTDFRVAPVYLKSVRRIAGLLSLYFFVLMTQALLERELRKAMGRDDVESLPIYPERRPCLRPTTRKLIDLFEGVERHTLQIRGRKPTTLVTELSRAQRKVLKLLRLPVTEYGA